MIQSCCRCWSENRNPELAEVPSRGKLLPAQRDDLEGMDPPLYASFACDELHNILKLAELLSLDLRDLVDLVDAGIFDVFHTVAGFFTALNLLIVLGLYSFDNFLTTSCVRAQWICCPA